MSAFLLTALVLLYTGCHGIDPTVVQTEYGTIRGLDIGDGTRVFRSIPYARAPLGELRWASPQPPVVWNDVLDCTKEVIGCPQSCHELPLDATECPHVTSEDCLFLNVWTPNTATSESALNVLLFIHGGSFWTGYSGGIVYNGTQFVNQTETIIVTINYRLGALGALYDESLGLYGNYGFLDQVFAIDWAYRNIANFGGNPERITIFGESAGAASVALHLLNKSSIIAGAIMESPPIGLPLRTNVSWGTLPLTLSKEVGCDPQSLSDKRRLDCLRKVNASVLVEAQVSANKNDPQKGFELIKSGMPWTPTVRTKLLIDHPVLAIINGEYNTEVAWMAGTNSGESFLFTPPYVPQDYITYELFNSFPAEDALRIKEFYNVSSDNSGVDNLYETFGTCLTDYQFRCPTRAAVAASLSHASQNSSVAYFYHYNYIASFAKHAWYYQPECWTHVCHTEELPMVFNANASSIDLYPTPEEQSLSQQLQFMWANFAETGNPGEGKHAAKLNQIWLNYGSLQSQSTLMINSVGKRGIAMQNAPDQEVCEFWDSLGYNWYNGNV